MNDLQIGLFFLSLFLILLILLINWKQSKKINYKKEERSSLKKVSQNENFFFDQGHSIRQEPIISDFPEKNSRLETVDDTEKNNFDPIDKAIESIINIRFYNKIQGLYLISFLSNLKNLSYRGNTIRLCAEDEKGIDQFFLKKNAFYQSVKVIILLVNRSGPIKIDEYSKILNYCKVFSARFNSLINVPKENEVLEQASKLDKICSELDFQLNVNLVLEKAKPLTEIMEIASLIGFLEKESVIFLKLRKSSACLLLLTDKNESSNVSKINLILDLPNNPRNNFAFSQITEIATILSSRLNAKILDDCHEPVDLKNVQFIDVQLSHLYDKLKKFGLEAGSRRAIRVFS